LRQPQRQHTIGDLRFHMIRVDSSRQTQGARERAVRQFAQKIAILIRLVFAFDADHILQHLNAQVVGFESRHECGLENFTLPITKNWPMEIIGQFIFSQY
jgi:hypothetical protein